MCVQSSAQAWGSKDDCRSQCSPSAECVQGSDPALRRGADAFTYWAIALFNFSIKNLGWYFLKDGNMIWNPCHNHFAGFEIFFQMWFFFLTEYADLPCPPWCQSLSIRLTISTLEVYLYLEALSPPLRSHCFSSVERFPDEFRCLSKYPWSLSRPLPYHQTPCWNDAKCFLTRLWTPGGHRRSPWHP